jgi:probable HAF family extracellular repeat protein
MSPIRLCGDSDILSGYPMRSQSFAHAYSLFLLLCCGAVSSAASYSFQALGGLGGATSFNSNASALSADGSVVVGGIGGSGLPRQAFTWTLNDGMVGLGHLPGNPFGAGAHGVSADGSIVVGEDGSFPPNGFRWTASGGMVGLGALPGGSFNSGAMALSADGSVIVGNSSSSEGTQAFRWMTGGMEGLGDLAGGVFSSTALAVSADGDVIVGNGTSAVGTEAFRWTPASGMVGLGYLRAGGSSSYARGVSGDGSVIVGDSDRTVFLWTAAAGMVDRKSLLQAHGVTGVSGWQLSVGAAISADGHTIVGTGFSPAGRSEAWIATIPEPSSAVLVMTGLLAWSMRRLLRRKPG